MKTTKIIAALAAMALAGTTVFADELIPTIATTAKGSQAQSYVLFRLAGDYSLALYTGERGVITMSATQPPGELAPAMHSNLKEQSIVLFWAQ